MHTPYRALAGSLALALLATACGGRGSLPSSGLAGSGASPTGSQSRFAMGAVPHPQGIFSASEGGRRVPTAPTKISVLLQYNDQAGLDQLVRDQANPASGRYHQFLTPAQFSVLRHEGTERPFTSPLNEEKHPGVFVCAACALPLFSSQMKFESGTGWPSFFTLIPGSLATKQDLLLVLPRTEYHCVRCAGHQGHVFDDGPPPTGLRYCNNGVALRFIAQKSA